MGSKRSLHLLIADTHGGGKLALLPPNLVLQDEQDDPWIPELTHSQERIYRVWTKALENVRYLAKKSPIYAYHNGDLTHGNHHDDKELVSTRMSDHIEIAIANMADVLRIPQVKRMLLLKGTGSHEFGQGSATNLVAKGLDILFDDKQVEAVGHALVKSSGVTFDLAHHGPTPGKRVWTRGNELRLYVRSLMMDLLQNGQETPDILARAHFHNYARETVTIRASGQTHVTTGFVLPSFSFLDDYARKVARSPTKVTIGALVIEVYDGKVLEVYDDEPAFMQTFDLRKEVSLDE